MQNSIGVIYLQKQSVWKACIAGLLTGLVNGFFGAGGGMLLVPLLTSLCRLEDKAAFASSISVILPICIASLVVYAWKGSLSLGDAWPYLLGGLLGGSLGGILFQRVSANMLHKLLGALILWGGVRLVFAL